MKAVVERWAEGAAIATVAVMPGITSVLVTVPLVPAMTIADAVPAMWPLLVFSRLPVLVKMLQARVLMAPSLMKTRCW